MKKIVLYALLSLWGSSIIGNEQAGVKFATDDVIKDFNHLFALWKQDGQADCSTLFNNLKESFEKSPINVDIIELDNQTIGAHLRNFLFNEDAWVITISADRLLEAAKNSAIAAAAKSITTSSFLFLESFLISFTKFAMEERSRIIYQEKKNCKAKALQLAHLVQIHRTDKTAIFRDMFEKWQGDSLTFDLLEEWFTKHPVDVDDTPLASGRSIAQEIDNLLQTNRPKGLEIARLVQERRSKKLAVMECLFNLSKGDNAALESLKEWLERYPINVDKETFDSQQSVGDEINVLIKSHRTVGLSVARLVQDSRTDRHAVLRFLIRLSSQDHSAFEDLKFWYGLYPTDVDEEVFNSIRTLGQEINELLKTNRALGLKIAWLVQAERRNKGEVFIFLFEEWMNNNRTTGEQLELLTTVRNHNDRHTLVVSLENLLAQEVSIFSDLQAWFNKFPINIDEQGRVGEEIKFLLRTNRSQGLKIAELVQKKRSKKTEICNFLYTLPRAVPFKIIDLCGLIL